MELFLFRHAEYERLYNCTGLDIDAIPLEKRQFVPESIAICVLCAIYYVLYVPCMYSIWLHLRDNSCYKLLFYIGITDLANLWILGFFSGWLNLHGAVFCSFPTLNYFVGVAVLALWIAESTADLILAFNRCLELSSSRFSRLLFSGHRTLLWLFGCSLYALYWAVFVKPTVYSSVYFGWFFFPFVGYRPDDQHELQFAVQLHTFHDILVAFLCPGIYLIFALVLCASSYDFNTMQKKVLMVFLVSLINTLTGSLYVYMQHNDFRQQWMLTLAEFAWFHAHGFPPVIYLALNKTIRKDSCALFMKLFQRHRVSSLGVVAVSAPKTVTPANGVGRSAQQQQ
ncbi:hypothetical protein niasHS_017866 [Heterodera schachtii]|uniref:Uncharacterized protein n=1 Tax=Heterodera schachtii TaxID=97005 RepID=A0ABD2HY95_HETSC